jgi:arylsulfatase A-like enzyme
MKRALIRARQPLLLGALTCLAVACSDNSATPTAVHKKPALEYIDLGARLEEQRVVAGRRLHPTAWKLGERTLATVLQHPPSRVSLTLQPADGRDRENCRMRFALGIKEEAWPTSDGVRFRVWSPEPDGDVLLFEESFDPRELGDARWHDREFEIPTYSAELILETDAGPSGDNESDEAGWAAPRIICEGSEREPRRAQPHPDIIVISLDTLRADHLGAYGYDKDTSPVLDAFAEESWVFDNAFAVAPFTMPTHASMFTGLYPDEHGAGHTAPFAPLGPGPATLAEILSAAGYRTLAFTGGGILSDRNGFDRGFTRWTNRTRATLDSMLPSVYAALDESDDTPTFLFLHTYDIHGPYPTPDSSHSAAEDELPGDREEWKRILKLPNHRYLELDRFAGLDEVVAGYDSGIRRVDGMLGELFARLRAIGMWDDSIVLVTSDHGESLYERGLYIGHSFTLFDEELRIPFLLRLPGGLDGSRQSELVDQTDILPTLLDAAGLEAPTSLSGVSALRRVQGFAPSREEVRGEAAHTGARFRRTARLKVISEAHSPESSNSRVPAPLRPRFEAETQVFDLETDAAEVHNLHETAGAPAGIAELMRRVEATPQPGSVQLNRGDFPREVLEQLRELGYIE